MTDKQQPPAAPERRIPERIWYDTNPHSDNPYERNRVIEDDDWIPYARVHPVDDARVGEIRKRLAVEYEHDIAPNQRMLADIKHLLSLLPQFSSSERRCRECGCTDGLFGPDGQCVFGCKCVFPATGAAEDLVDRNAAMRAICSWCANPDRYGPPVAIEGSRRLFHFQIADNWNAGQCDAQVIKELPVAALGIAGCSCRGGHDHFGEMLRALISIYDYTGNDVQALKNTAYRAIPNTECQKSATTGAVAERAAKDVLVRRFDAARLAELINDSIKAKGKFAAAILMMPPYPAPDCPICGYPIDNEGLCVLDAAHTASPVPVTEGEPQEDPHPGYDCSGTCAIHQFGSTPSESDIVRDARLTDCEIDELKELLEDTKRGAVFTQRVLDAVTAGRPAPTAAPVVGLAQDDDSEGLTGCLDDDDPLSQALRQITPERLNEILAEELPNRSGSDTLSCLGCIASRAGVGRCLVHQPRGTVTPSEAARGAATEIIGPYTGEIQCPWCSVHKHRQPCSFRCGQARLDNATYERRVVTTAETISRHFPPTEATQPQTWCDHCSANLSGVKHILCDRCYQELNESTYTRESLRATILDWLAHRCDRAPACGNCTYCRVAAWVRSVDVTEAMQPAGEARDHS